MTRLTELHGALAARTEVQWDRRSVDVESVIRRARALRAQFMAGHLRRGLRAFGRWSGLTALVQAVRHRLHRRRTLHALSQLDDRLLSDIGVRRIDIEATAVTCSGKPAAADSVWHQLASWIGRERRRRRTLRELSAMPDEMLADIGIQRSDIPAIAASLLVERESEAPTGEKAEVASDLPVTAATTAAVLAFIQVGRSLRQAANENVGRPAA